MVIIMAALCYRAAIINTGCKKIAILAPSHNFVGYIFATKACIDSWKKLVKQQYLLHVSSQYGELWPTNG